MGGPGGDAAHRPGDGGRAPTDRWPARGNGFQDMFGRWQDGGPDVELARLCVELGNGWGMSEKGEGHLAAHDRQEQLGPKMEEQEGKNKTHGVWSDCDWVGRVSRLDDRDAKEKMRSSSCSCERVRLAGESTSTASEPPGIRGLENKRERWPSFVQ